jgi:hypothetical protein
MKAVESKPKKLHVKRLKAKTTITSWPDLLSNKSIMGLIVPLLHVFDLVHLAQCCHHLHSFYYSSKLKHIIQPIVMKYCKTKTSLRELGKVRNVKNVQRGNMAGRVRMSMFPANKRDLYEENRLIWRIAYCSVCNDRHPAMVPDNIKYAYCYKCSSRKLYFDKYLYDEIYQVYLYSLYSAADLMRISRIIKRHENDLRLPDYDVSREILYYQSTHENIKKDIIRQISCLDIRQIVILRYPESNVISNNRKRNRSEIEIEDLDTNPTSEKDSKVDQLESQSKQQIQTKLNTIPFYYWNPDFKTKEGFTLEECMDRFGTALLTHPRMNDYDIKVIFLDEKKTRERVWILWIKNIATGVYMKVTQYQNKPEYIVQGDI